MRATLKRVEVKKFKAIWLLRDPGAPRMGWLEGGTGNEVKDVVGLVPRHISDQIIVTIEREP
jgi:hypothetical protein